MRDVMAYYWAIFSSWLLVLVITLGMLAPHIRREPLTGLGTLMKEILRFGAYVQFANIFQTLNYRLSLKFTDLFLGRGSVGVLSLGMQLAEGLWIISRSIATVQFSKLANSADREYGVRLTLTLAKATLLITAAAMVVLLAIPGSVFVFLFSDGFAQVKLVIASLAIGIVALSVSMILSGFFSGINKPWHNTISSAIGLVFTVLAGILLIPKYGIAGAGFAATVSYSIATLYQFVVFLRVGKVGAKDLLITGGEIRKFSGEIRSILNNRLTNNDF
jgi:O-antigen/teichoic acid export membrane protein